MYEQLTSKENQRLLIRFMLSDPAAYTRSQSIIKADYFDDTLRKVVRFIQSYSDEYRALPNFDQVRAATNEELSAYPNPESQQEWYFDTVEEFCRNRALELAILNGAEKLAEGRAGEIEKEIKDALTIALVSDLGSQFGQNPAGLLARISDRSNIVPTGWHVLDDKLFGGFTRGSLNIFAGGSGSGKSLFLQNLALNWAQRGLKVVYVSLELSEDFVSQRLFAMATGMGTVEIGAHQGKAVARLEAAFDASKSDLLVKKFAESTTTANDLRAFLKEYEIKKGCRPDAVLVDYLDLMAPNNARIDVSSLFTKDKFVSEELRALASELNVPLVTASQLNRSAVSADAHDHSHIAGGISKVNTADNVLSILINRKKKDAGIQELQFLKTRTSDSVGSKIELGYDWKSMRITNDPPLVVPPTPAVVAVTDESETLALPHSDRLKEIMARTRRAASN